MHDNRAGEHAALDVAALADQVLGRVAMADPLDVLLDDRPLVEVGGDIMRGGADHLHAARMRLVIGLGALEAGQEAVVDVDAAARQEARQIVGQDLHVAREHDESAPVSVDQRLDLRFLLAAWCRADRQVVERDVAEIDVLVKRLARMVGDDADDVHAQFADAASGRADRQAMVEFETSSSTLRRAPGADLTSPCQTVRRSARSRRDRRIADASLVHEGRRRRA